MNALDSPEKYFPFITCSFPTLSRLPGSLVNLTDRTPLIDFPGTTQRISNSQKRTEKLQVRSGTPKHWGWRWLTAGGVAITLSDRDHSVWQWLKRRNVAAVRDVSWKTIKHSVATMLSDIAEWLCPKKILLVREADRVRIAQRFIAGVP